MTTVTNLSVTGMTCANCVSAVTRELKGVAEVQDVTVELHAGDTSSVRVISKLPLPEAALRDAIAEAGYDVVNVEVVENAVAAEYAAQAPARQATHTLPVVDARSGAGKAGGTAGQAPHDAPSEEKHHHEANGGGHAGCACGCGGQGRQGLGIGLPIVPLR
jgi:copper chaperone CopZ